MDLKTAYLWYRSRTRTARHDAPDFPNVAWDSMKQARSDVALYAEAMAAGDTKTAAKIRRYLPSQGPFHGWSQSPAPARTGRRMMWIERPRAAGLREVGRVVPESYGGSDSWGGCGWHTDPYGDVFKDDTGLCYGLVFQLPARNGKARFVGGYQFGGQDGGPDVDMGHIFESDERGDAWNCNPREHDAARQAAQHADSMAREAAERERAYQTAWQAGSQFADQAAIVRETRAETLAALAERRALPEGLNAPGLCNLLRASVRDALRTIEAARRRMATLAAGNDSTLCFHPDQSAKDAFCEGAGLERFPG